MSSINQLQTTLQNIYNQVGANVPASKAGLIDHNVLHNLGLSANLLQNLRNDLSAVANGSNPERALNNLMSGLQQISGSTNARAKEWPADKLLPEGGVHLVKGADGQPEAVTAAKEWPVDKPLPEGGVHLVKGTDGQPEAVIAAKEWPVDKPLPEGGVHLVKGEDGQPKEVDASGVPRSDLANVPSSVQASADAVISNLFEVLGVQAAGGDISQASAKMRTALDSLFDRTNPTQVRDALRNSINELA